MRVALVYFRLMVWVLVFGGFGLGDAFGCCVAVSGLCGLVLLVLVLSFGGCFVVARFWFWVGVALVVCCWLELICYCIVVTPFTCLPCLFRVV